MNTKITVPYTLLSPGNMICARCENSFVLPVNKETVKVAVCPYCGLSFYTHVGKNVWHYFQDDFFATQRKPAPPLDHGLDNSAFMNASFGSANPSIASTAEVKYEGGGLRSSDEKPDYEAMLSPLAMEAYAEYMFMNSFLEDGSRRDEDNWQAGVPLARWLKSLFRHCFTLHKLHRSNLCLKLHVVVAVCAILFNAFGYLHEYLKQHPEALEALKNETAQRQARRK